AAGNPLGHDHHELDAVLEGFEHRVLGERGGDGDDRAVDRAAMVSDRLGDRVEHRDAVDVAAEAARGHAADDLGAFAVVEALPGQIDGLAAGDPLDDEGGVVVDQDAHQAALPAPAGAPWIFSTARRAASCSETVRSAYSTPWARTASNRVSEPPPAPITSPRFPSNSVTFPATPRWSWASTCSPASSNGVGSRACRVSSSPTPSSLSSAFCRGRPSFSMSMWASRATNDPSSSSPSGLISASVMSYWRNSRARRATIGVRRFSAEPVTPSEAI